MDRVILQVPMSKSLKMQAEAVSQDYGFSSLQETIRVILRKLSTRELKIHIADEREERLSPKAEKRYAKMISNIKEGKNVVYTKDADDFLEKLRS